MGLRTMHLILALAQLGFRRASQDDGVSAFFGFRGNPNKKLDSSQCWCRLRSSGLGLQIGFRGMYEANGYPGSGHR